MVLVDRVRDIWGDGNARQIELIDVTAPRLNDSEKHLNFLKSSTNFPFSC